MSKSAIVLMTTLALLVAACGSSSSSSTKTSSSTSAASSSSSAAGGVSLATKTLPGVGSVLVNGQGRTLYVFMPDNATKVTCTGACATVWPPLKIAAGQKPATSGGVDASKVSSDSNPSGGDVVTYAGWPLYLYVADPNPGTDHGQGINSSGGLWYVIAPSGTVVKGKSGGGASTSSGGAYSSGGSGYRAVSDNPRRWRSISARS